MDHLTCRVATTPDQWMMIWVTVVVDADVVEEEAVDEVEEEVEAAEVAESTMLITTVEVDRAITSSPSTVTMQILQGRHRIKMNKLDRPRWN